MENLAKNFKETIIPTLKKELNYKNDFELPMVEKVVVSVGIGDYKDDKNAIAHIVDEISRITGRKAKTNLSRKAVSAFKLRIGQTVGLTTTLRGQIMYDFITKLVNIALPRVRDFRGLPTTSFDQQGNYTVGIKDYTIFPEIKFEEVKEPFGLEVNLKIRAKSPADAKLLLQHLGFPFKKESK
ncbi:MAG: 50S ribosomal protein L5 [Candidatus Berkelbacteria bacterium]|nr:50S ribosomal protein L5 [Candidatus Berkelbacteria bacterium]